MTPTARPHCHRRGLSRREVLQVGFSGLLGLNFSQVLGKAAASENGASNFGKAKSVTPLYS